MSVPIIKGKKQNNRRKYPGLRDGHTYHRRDAISARNAARRSGRDAIDQIDVLDARLGVGIGATRERARLAKQIRGGR